MTIDRLGSIDPVARINKKNNPDKVKKQVSPDSVAVSEEARRSAALQQTVDIVRATPDVRMDRVEEVKNKLQDPNYMDDAVIKAVADEILDAFGV